MSKPDRAFTLVEMMVAVTVLAILIVAVSRIVGTASALTAAGNKRIDIDSQVGLVLDRMATDIAQMIRRTDVDFYSKGLDPETGNDRIAFFSAVPGYYPRTGSTSPLSLVSYRVNADSTSNSYNRMERMGKGLVWSGVSPTATPSAIPSPNPQWIIFGGSPTLQTNWPSATLGNPANPNYKDPDFELIGSEIFRFEYFYLLTDGTVTDGVSPNTSVAAGFQNVTAIAVTVAAIDPKSRLVLDAASQQPAPSDNMTQLAGKLVDYNASMKPGDLLKQWQAALDTTTGMPKQPLTAVKLFQRYFYLR